MLGLRSQYALSTFFIAEMRQNLHFTYLQDDIRVNDKLTLNAGLRYEYATPMWEANNVLTNFDPVNKAMVTAKDGSIADRALVDPDRNNFGPRLGLAYTLAAENRRPRRLGHRATSTSTASARPTCWRSTARRSCAPPSSRATRPRPAFRPTEQGYPAGLTDPSKFNPLTALISYIPRDLPLEPGAELVRCRSSASSDRSMLRRRRLRRQQGGRPAAGRQLQPGGAQQRRRATIPLASRRPIPTFGDITYVFNGGKSRYEALPGEVRVADGRRRHAAQLADAVEGKGQFGAARSRTRTATSRRRRTSATSTPTSALGATISRTTARRASSWALPFGHGKRWGSGIPPALDVARRRLAAGRHQHDHAWRDGDVHLLAGRAVPGVGDHQRLLGREQLPAEHHVRPVRAGRSVDHAAGSTRRASSLPTDPSQPFGNAPRNNVRGPNFWQFDLAASKNVALGGQARLQLRLEAFNLFNRVNFTPPAANRSNSTFGTITGTFDQRQVQLGVKVLW